MTPVPEPGRAPGREPGRAPGPAPGPEPGPAPGPPVAPAEPLVREVHGIRTGDPYAWMTGHEDPRLLPLLAAERAHYDAETAALRPLRDTLAAEFTARLPPDEDSLPWRRGRYVYWERTPAGSEYPQLCRRPANETRPGEVVLDGEAIAAGAGKPAHRHFAYGVCEPSPDGRWIAYSADFTGEESYELRFRDTASGTDTGGITGTYYGCAWSADSAAFFYVTHDASYRPCRVHRHAPGTAAGELVYTEPDERYHVTVSATRSGTWIVITSAARDTNEQRLIPAATPATPPRLAEARRRGIEYSIEHVAPPSAPGQPAPGEGTFVILTNDGAPEYRVMRAPVSSPGRGNWEELVPGDPGTRYRRQDVINGHLVLSCRAVATGEPFLRFVRPDGTSHDQHPGTAAGLIELAGTDPYAAAAATVSTQSLVAPKRWWSVDLHTGERSLLRATDLPGYRESDFHTERLYAPAPDGELIPVTVACRKGGQPGARDRPGTGDQPGRAGPCLITGYGAYEVCRDPRFSVSLASLLERGFVYAIAHVRGGGERGRRWWLDGRLGAKHNTFTDFRAARDCLVAGGWAAPGRVTARGLSAGGLTVGAGYTWWPEAWAAVVAEAPAVDLLNVMLDPAAPLTVNEYGEWGDPADPEQFGWMRSYTPYENVAGFVAGSAARRPPLLVTGMLRDPRVAVHEPAKWVAALRAAGVPPDRLLFRVDLASGAHRGPSGRSGSLGYEAEILAWVLAAS